MAGGGSLRRGGRRGGLQRDVVRPAGVEPRLVQRPLRPVAPDRRRPARRSTQSPEATRDLPGGGLSTTNVCEGLCGMHYKRRLRHGNPLAGERPTECAVAGCTRPARARGWCQGHYLRWYRTGDVRPHEPLSRLKQPATCVVEGCGRGSHTRGLCQTHYKRLLKHGDPQADKPVRVVSERGPSVTATGRSPYHPSCVTSSTGGSRPRSTVSSWPSTSAGHSTLTRSFIT
jgi:hypothetical protein